MPDGLSCLPDCGRLARSGFLGGRDPSEDKVGLEVVWVNGREEVSRHLYRLITPFTEDGRKVDEPALRRLVDFQIAEGIHGLIPPGSTGEFLSVTPDERRRSSRSWLARLPDACRC